MGQRQDRTEIVYGDDCFLKFAAGKTPKYVYARFSLIVPCPGALFTPPNDRVFKLTQVDGHPCWWSIIIPGSWVVRFEYEAGPPRTKLILSAPPAFLFFNGLENEYVDEGYVFQSTQKVCAGWVHGIGGIGIVTWQLETIALMNALNIKAQYDLFMEMRPLDDGSRVYKYCKLKDATNIAIKLEP